MQNSQGFFITREDRNLLTPSHLETIACACHEANRHYCLNLGDRSQLPWSDAPEWQKDSAIDGVKFAIANDFPSPQEMHENWRKLKEESGWVYGEIKDANLKTHPCMVPYAELPQAQKVKDMLFRDTCISKIQQILRNVKADVARKVMLEEAEKAKAEPGSEPMFPHTDRDELDAWIAQRQYPTVTRDSIESKIQKVEYVRSGVMMWCVITMQNGFTVTGDPSACVDPRNFDEVKGKQIAFDNAFDRIWALEGYLLKEKLYAQKLRDEIKRKEEPELLYGGEPGNKPYSNEADGLGHVMGNPEG